MTQECQRVAHLLSLERRGWVHEKELSEHDKLTTGLEATDTVPHLLMPSFQNPGNWQP